VANFRFEGQRLDYTEYGRVPKNDEAGRRERAQETDRPLILLHGLLLSQEMHRPLAEDLAVRGNRVITLDLLGHGKSDRPRDMWRYSMATFGEQVVALMDHLGLERAAVMGTSLGANAALEVAAKNPERLRGLVIEMPVLDNGLLGSALAFTPLLVSLTFGEPLMRVLSRATRAVPRRILPHWGNVMLDLVRQDPGPGGAVLQGLFFGRVAPPREERRTFMTPTLVLGHPRDPIHPFSDAGMLAREMPAARLLEADSLIELRVQPERLTDEIAGFLEELWSPGGVRRNGRPAAAARGKRAARAKAPARPAKRPAAARARGTARRRSAG
jgi:pimeloyl-ACP methyl ester carboxylesterase